MDARFCKVVLLLLLCCSLAVAIELNAGTFARIAESEPEFLIGMGVPKAGTTSLYSFMSKQPQLILPGTKELHYWDRAAKGDGTLEGYLRRWTGSIQNATDLSGKFFFEVTPHYLQHPSIPRKIYENIPNVKFILLLREPIARWLSAVNMNRKNCFNTKHPKKDCCSLFRRSQEIIDDALLALEDENCQIGGDPFKCTPEGAFKGSLYPARLKIWFEYFDPSQFLILQYEDHKDQNAMMKRICDFAGLENCTFMEDAEKNTAHFYYSDLVGEMDKRVIDFFDEENEATYRLLESHGFNITPFKPYQPPRASELGLDVQDLNEGAIHCCKTYWKDVSIEEMDPFCQTVMKSATTDVADKEKLPEPSTQREDFNRSTKLLKQRFFELTGDLQPLESPRWFFKHFAAAIEGVFIAGAVILFYHIHRGGIRR